MGPEVLADIFVPLSFFGLIFGIVYVRNRENMALIERGINPRAKPVRPQQEGPYYLKYALLLIGVGVGMLLGRIIDTTMLPHHLLANGLPDAAVEHRNKLIYFALIAIFGGIGLVIAYFMERKEWAARQSTKQDAQKSLHDHPTL